MKRAAAPQPTLDPAGASAEPGSEGRVAKRRRATRARLVEAAHDVIAEVGLDDAKIKDITDRADVGFGTFYNYFQTKEEVAGQALDCVIEDLGRRNVAATRAIRDADPGLVMPVSIRLVLRETTRDPMWQWWALHTDMLTDRMRDGFAPFGKRDIRDALAAGVFQLRDDRIDAAWAMANWMIVGGIHDVVVGRQPPEIESFVAEAIMRVMGVDVARAAAIAHTPLPRYPRPRIDWNFTFAQAAPIE